MKRKGEKRKSGLIFQLRRFCFSLFFVFFACCAVKVSAQNLVEFSNQIQFGTTEIKRDTLLQIRNLQSAEASRIAISALRDKAEIVRATAVSSIIYLPKEESLPLLLPLLLRDKSEFVRRETAAALGKTQNPDAVNPLIQAFQNNKITEVKNAAIIALGEIGDVSAIEFLTKIFAPKPNDDNEFLRRSAARSIGQIAQIIQIRKSDVVTPENFLPEKYKTFTLEKYRNLSDTLPQFRRAVAVLTKLLQNRNESDDAKRESAFALGTIGDVSAIQILEQNLNSPDNYLAEICREAVFKLSKINSPN